MESPPSLLIVSLLLAEGTYAQSFKLTKSGTAGNIITSTSRAIGTNNKETTYEAS
jgi:hypothetical protein